MTMDVDEQIRLLGEKTNAKREEQKLKNAAKKGDMELLSQLRSKEKDEAAALSTEVIKLKHRLEPELRDLDRKDRVFYANIDLQEYKERAITDKYIRSGDVQQVTRSTIIANSTDIYLKRLAEQKRLDQEHQQTEKLKILDAELEKDVFAFKKRVEKEVELDFLKKVKELGLSSVKDLSQDELDKIARDTLAGLEKAGKPLN